MADPLSITLAAISLATALKDLIELSQMIEESFAKAADNTRNLQALGAEISATVRELNHFCYEHYTILSEAKNMKIALLELITDMTTVHNRCCQMIPPKPAKTLGKFKIAFKGWKNRGKIESEILELRNRVNKCQSRFMMFTVMRIEKRLVTIGESNPTTSATRRRLSNESLIAFVGFNERTLSKLPPEITADFISDTYLRLQVDVIDVYLNDLSSRNSYPMEAPLIDYLRPYQPIIHVGPSVDRNNFRQLIVAQTLDTQQCLSSDSSTLSIQAGAWSMVNLSIGLHSLEMYKEAASMGLWTVNLFRTLVNTNPAVYSPYLVHALRLFSRFYIKLKDNDKAKVVIEEAILISRRLQSPFADPEIKFQLGEALITLAYVSDLIGDSGASLEAAQQGVHVYEDMVIKSYIPNIDTNTEAHPSTTNQWALALERFSAKAVQDYSRALDQLSYSLQNMKLLEEAAQTAIKALDIILNSELFFTDSIQVYVASLFYRLSHQQFHSVIKLEQALVFVQQSINIYRVLCEDDRRQHIQFLCEALYEKANILGKLERYDDALAVWKETADLAKDIIDNQTFRADALDELSWSYRKLNRPEEAALIRTESVTVYQMAVNSTSDKTAHGYYNLGVDLRLAGRLSEAIEALRTALMKYRALAFNDPSQYTTNIAMTLNQLTLNFIHCNGHDEAFNDGHESLKLHGTMIENNQSVLDGYMFALRINFSLAEVADNEAKCLERVRYTIICARELANHFPEKCNMLLMQAILSQSIVFSRFERLSEASDVIKESINWFEHNPCQSPRDAEQYIYCLITSGSIAYNQGYMHMPLDLFERSIEVAKLYSSDPVIADLLIASMYRRAEVLSMLGLCVKAANTSVECETLARQNDSCSAINLIYCLRVCSMSFMRVGEFGRSLTYTEEALQLCGADKLEKEAKTKSFAHLLESECLCSLSECLAENGREPEALIRAKQSLNAALALKNKYPTLPWSEIEPSYLDALHTLSMRLAANDDLPGALETIVEVRLYYEKRSQHRNGASISLARSLRIEGLLYCAAGRHDEGITARTKLQELQKRLAVTLPELAEQICLQLANDSTFPSTTSLLSKLNLTCEHQQETTH